jgi:single-strand DNA-binding protein
MFAKIQVIGHLGNDPEIRHLPSGTINGNFSVATNRPKYTDKNTGEVVTPPPTWFRLVAYQTGEKAGHPLIQWLKRASWCSARRAAPAQVHR